jgi:rhodanese-related sulfurtransferase
LAWFIFKRRIYETINRGLAIVALSLCATASFAQQERRYEVDPKTKWAVGAKQTPADQLKKQLDSGAVMIIDVRPPANFEKETIPGAINVPLEQLDGYLKNISKDTYIVFTWGTGVSSSQAAKLAEDLGFKSTTFCPVSKWKEQGYQAEPGKNKWLGKSPMVMPISDWCCAVGFSDGHTREIAILSIREDGRVSTRRTDRESHMDSTILPDDNDW